MRSRPSEPEQRLFWIADLRPGAKSEDGEPASVTASRRIAPEAEANLIGSLTDQGNHMPVLDIDRMNVRVVESSTPGNFHLYIDKPMSWHIYEGLLDALADAGIIEPGYHRASVERKGTFVRKPGIKKEAS